MTAITFRTYISIICAGLWSLQLSDHPETA
jgi:hypothetical protein